MIEHASVRPKKAFSWVMFTCVQFVLLTLAAMVIYPGGNFANPGAARYSFFLNFFSELGLTVAYGVPNPVGVLLFSTALTLAGTGLIAYFWFSPWFFREERLARSAAQAGSVFGVLAGLSFIGVAFTPADLFLPAHEQFVFWAFFLFTPASLIYGFLMWRQPDYPNKYAAVFGVFSLMLAAYVVLIVSGADVDTVAGLRIQATSQKIIGYASLIIILVQSAGARRLLAGRT